MSISNIVNSGAGILGDGLFNTLLQKKTGTRHQLLDVLQNFPFHIIDMTGPMLDGVMSVFSPVCGFSAMSTPEWAADVHQFVPATSMTQRGVIKNAVVGNINLSRGTRVFNSDFHDWFLGALRGTTAKRNLLVFHYMINTKYGVKAVDKAVKQFGKVLNGINVFGLDFDGSTITRVAGRMIFLKNCLPVRYKAGSDFDAMSSDASVEELELHCEEFYSLHMASAKQMAENTSNAVSGISGLISG